MRNETKSSPESVTGKYLDTKKTELTEERARTSIRKRGAECNNKLVDQKAIRECKDRVKQIEKKIKEERAAGNQERLEDLEEEQKKLQKYLSSATDIKGRSRRIPDEKEKARKTVNKAVKEALEKIRGYNITLYTHLKDTLKTGSTLSYRPTERIQWD